MTALGAFTATQLTIVVDRRRQARAAMLLCGEVLAVVRRFLRHVHEQRQAMGALDARSWRMLHAARRELRVYERNREILLHIHDPHLRARIHSIMVRLTIPLEVLMEASCGPDAKNLEPDHLFSVDLVCGQHEPVSSLLEQLQHRCGQTFHHFDWLDGDPGSLPLSYGHEEGGASSPVAPPRPRPRSLF